MGWPMFLAQLHVTVANVTLPKMVAILESMTRPSVDLLTMLIMVMTVTVVTARRSPVSVTNRECWWLLSSWHRLDSCRIEQRVERLQVLTDVGEIGLATLRQATASGCR